MTAGKYAPFIAKEPVAAYKSQYAGTLCRNSVIARLAVAHIRYKTYGSSGYDNTHPFHIRVKGEDWVLAHNGSIETVHFKKLSIKPVGDTDSEKALCFIAERLDKLPNGAGDKEKAGCIEDAVTFLSGYGKLNLMITNGRQLFVHTNCAGTLFMHKKDGAVLFCTEPVLQQANWVKAPLNRLHVYEDGEKIYEGKKHDYEYINPTSTQFQQNWRGGGLWQETDQSKYLYTGL